MRNLFLVLVLANLAFAAWHAWFSGPTYPTEPISSGAPTIQLFAEPDSSSTTLASVASSPAGPGTPLLDCLSLGPFPNRVDVQDAEAALEGADFTVRQRTADGEVWLGYWVYLDAIETQAEAATMVDTLGEAGISEAYVIADGNNGNIVSLGVFSERARAQQRFADVEDLGMSPVTANRSQPGEVFWLDVRTVSGRRFQQSDLPDISVDPELQFADCIE